MGLDVEIEIRAKQGYIPPSPNAIDGTVADCGWQPSYADSPPEFTHTLRSLTRYYGPSYERGPWPEIAAYLLTLMADPNIETVWYGHDCDEYKAVVTLEWLTQMNLHYVDNAERPFREGATSVRRTVSVKIEGPPSSDQ